ncbi:hypothetical protein HDU81_008132 [Chytriomyces hyalinus]|nr:hypothetical protein HDU81_008132 [Chytriomyces hyalinus]
MPAIAALAIYANYAPAPVLASAPATTLEIWYGAVLTMQLDTNLEKLETLEKLKAQCDQEMMQMKRDHALEVQPLCRKIAQLECTEVGLWQ